MRKSIVTRKALWYNVYKVLATWMRTQYRRLGLRVGGQVCRFHITGYGNC